MSGMETLSGMRASQCRPGLGFRPGLLHLLLLILTLLGVPPAVQAQEPVQARLDGVVTVGDSVTVLGGANVLLHRVDPANAGEIDSVRTTPDGRFQFVLPGVPDPEGRQEVYFASVRHQGILYFGSPLASAIQLDSLYRIQVFDTLAVDQADPAPRLAVRYLLVEELGADGWQVTDLLQLEVAGRNTLVAGQGGSTWSYPLPAGVQNVRVGGTDVAGETALVADGRVSVAAPLTPGLRQVVLRYELDSLAAAIPVPGGVPEMELLIRDPAPPLDVDGLLPTGTVALEDGAMYRRYVRADLPDTVVSFRATDAPLEIPMRWLAVVLALVFAGAGVVVLKRQSGPAPVGSGDVGGRETVPEDRKALVRQIAELDLAMEEAEDPAARQALQSRRQALMERLRSGP